MYRTEAQGSTVAQMTIVLLLGGLLALGVVLLVLLLGAVAVSAGMLEEDFAVQITVIGCVFGCLIGGGFTCRHWSVRRLLAGLATGAVCFLLILAVGLFLSGGLELGAQGMIELAACLCGGAAAGLLHQKKKKGKAKRTSRRSR